MPSIATSMRLVLLSSAVFLLPACSHADSEGDAQPKATAAEAAASAEPAPEPVVEPAVGPAPAEAPDAEAVVEEMTLDPGELSELPDGSLEYCLDCRRQAATYHYCEFDKAALESALGDKLGETVELRVKKVAKNSTTDVPDVPNAPQPDGGFTRVHYTCTVDAVLPSK